MVIKSLDFRDHSVHPESVPGPKQPISISFNASHVSLAHKSLNPFFGFASVLLVYQPHIPAENNNTTVTTIFNNAETMGAF